MKAHQDDSKLTKNKIEFRKGFFTDLDGKKVHSEFDQCSYCGSISIEEVLKAFKTKGTRYSGADWKYSWPHKLYLEIPCKPYTHCFSSATRSGETIYEYTTTNFYRCKFYTEHLIDADQKQLEEWNKEIFPLVGLQFFVSDDEELHYLAKYKNYQSYGVV